MSQDQMLSSLQEDGLWEMNPGHNQVAELSGCIHACGHDVNNEPCFVVFEALV